MKKTIKTKLSFSKKTKTKIWYEEPCHNNPYLAKKCRLYGYELTELIEKKSYIDVLYLLFSGKLPTKNQAILLEKLMISCMNLGPRHPANRAAMTAGICKTRTVHLLPIGLMTLGGEHLGAVTVEQSMQFLNNHCSDDPEILADRILSKSSHPTIKGDWHIAPGFGSRFSGIDPLPNTIALHLSNILNDTKCAQTIKWGNQFVNILQSHQLGWLMPGIAAATFVDLDIAPREGSALFQLICSPGILAHALEQSHKPVTDMPFVEDENYVITQ